MVNVSVEKEEEEENKIKHFILINKSVKKRHYTPIHNLKKINKNENN